jgi:tRNA threonylcarbamoyladenosine biosynthesis protein TsaB
VSDYLLALDTTTEFGSVALISGGALGVEIPIHAPDGFGHVLFQQIEALLDRAGIALTEIGCYAAASGHGSFTGVRVGLTAIKGLAEAAAKPAVGVSNLRALAFFGQGPARATLLDARRGEVYGGMYDADLRPIAPETVAKFPVWIATVPVDAEIIGTDLRPFEPLLAGRPVLHAPRALASAVGRVAWQDWQSGHAQDPVALDANYVRRSDAELLWTEPR